MRKIFRTLTAITILVFITWTVRVSLFKENRSRIFKLRIPKIDKTLINIDTDNNLQHLPSIYLEGKTYDKKFNSTCRRYPSLKNIDFSNNYWQVLEGPNGTNIQILSAILDDRPLNKTNQSVRLVTMINNSNVTFTTYCQLWYENASDAVVVEVVNYQLMWVRAWGIVKNEYLPYLVTCNVPESYFNTTPQSVSLVNKPCDRARNNLKIIYEVPIEKENFAVCVKGLDFPDVDLSTRLIEWIELLLIFGVDKIYFYNLEVHPNVEAVLNYYKNLGNVVVIPASLPGSRPNIPELRHKLLKNSMLKRYFEVTLYNDCFLTNMYKYRYISLLDIDEIIVPLSGSSWLEMLNDIEEKGVKTTYVFQNVYFLDLFQNLTDYLDEDLPEYTYMLRNVYRAQSHSPKGYYVKSFHDTDMTLMLHNHFPLKCINGGCKKLSVSTMVGQLQHYRKDCYKNVQNCKEAKKHVILDNNLWRFKDVLLSRMEIVLNKLKVN